MSDSAPGAAPESAPARDLASLSVTERQHWRLTGEFPSAEPTRTEAPPPDASTPSTEADSSPAAPDAQAVSTETSQPPASEPGTPKKANAETRIKALLAERDALRAERDALLAQSSESLRARPPAAPDVPAKSSPAPQPETINAFVSHPDPTQPRLSDAQFFDRFPDATVADLAEYVANHTFARRDAERTQQQTRQGRLQGFREAWAKAVEADPEFTAVVKPIAEQLVPTDDLKPGQPRGPLNDAAQLILESSNGPAMLRHLADHPEAFDRLRTAPTRDAVIWTLGTIEAALATPVPPKTPVVKTTSSAPAPATTLGTRASAPADEAAAAVAVGDFGRYRSAMNRREVAAS